MQDQIGHLKRLGDEWAAAELHGDTTVLGRFLAEDFVAVGPRGFVLTKEQWLSRHEAGNLKYESFGLDEIQVRPHGDAAVAVLRHTAEWCIGETAAPTSQQSARHSFVTSRDWHCVATEPHAGPPSGRIPTRRKRMSSPTRPVRTDASGGHELASPRDPGA